MWSSEQVLVPDQEAEQSPWFSVQKVSGKALRWSFAAHVASIACQVATMQLPSTKPQPTTSSAALACLRGAAALTLPKEERPCGTVVT